MKVLYLSLKKAPFDVMVTGEKKFEFRKCSQWVKSRLIDRSGNKREYDVIKFVNGYSHDKRYFICKYEGFGLLVEDLEPIRYSNGLVVSDVKEGDIVIMCGIIIQREV